MYMQLFLTWCNMKYLTQMKHFYQKITWNDGYWMTTVHEICHPTDVKQYTNKDW